MLMEHLSAHYLDFTACSFKAAVVDTGERQWIVDILFVTQSMSVLRPGNKTLQSTMFLQNPLLPFIFLFHSQHSH